MHTHTYTHTPGCTLTHTHVHKPAHTVHKPAHTHTNTHTELCDALEQGVTYLHLVDLLGLLLALEAQLVAVVLLVPGLEGRGVDLHDRVLHQRLRSHQLVVGRVVHHIHDAGLACNGLQEKRGGGSGGRSE